MHYLMFYDCAPDYLARRGEFRALHLKHAWASHDRGELVLGGAYDDPADGAAILFKCDSTSIPEAFAKADPYVVNGLVTRWRIRRWNTVAGSASTNPLRG